MSSDQILQGIVLLIAFIFSVVVHENAHGVAAEHFGDPTARLSGRITMNPLPHIDPVGSIMLPLFAFVTGIPFIGWAKPVPVNSANLRNPIVHNAYVAAAGPASNFLMAVAAAIFYAIVLIVYQHVPGLRANGGNSLLFFSLLCRSMIQINCVLGVFNLLPVPPLDGHWILLRYLPPRYAEMLAAIRPYGFFIILALLWTHVIDVVLWFPQYILADGLLGAAYSVAGFL